MMTPSVEGFDPDSVQRQDRHPGSSGQVAWTQPKAAPYQHLPFPVCDMGTEQQLPLR